MLETAGFPRHVAQAARLCCVRANKALARCSSRDGMTCQRRETLRQRIQRILVRKIGIVVPRLGSNTERKPHTSQASRLCYVAAPPLLLVACCACVVLFGSSAVAADAPPLYETEPYDQITLDAANNNAVFKVFPLDLPNRQVPRNPKPTDEVRIRLLDYPDRQFDVAWQHIAKVELFEQSILNEANRLVAENEFDEAYSYFAFLLREQPELENLDESIEDYLLRDALAAFRGGRLHEALALLDELHRRNPARRGLPQAVQRVTTQLFDTYVAKREYIAARMMLEWATEQFGREQMAATLTAWQQRLAELATENLEIARVHASAERWREAYDLTREVLRIAPELPEADELARLIAQHYVSVTVGVTSQADPSSALLARDWAARRVRRLLDRSVTEVSGIGPDGGQYVAPFATIELSPDGRAFTVKLRRNIADGNTAQFSGFNLAEQLLSRGRAGDSTTAPLWSELVSEVRVEDVFNVNLQLRRSFLRPEALLQFPWSGPAGSAADVSHPYIPRENAEKNTLRFRSNENYALRSPRQPQDIVERFFPSTGAAIQALTRQEIDIIDRVYPADLDLIRAIDGVTVDNYAIPSVHMLIPNYERPFTGKRNFRRALVYGISRETLLRQDLLGGKEIAGCRLISGPFPAGRYDDDPLRYGYDPTIRPRPYEPRLAVTLAEIAYQELVTAAQKSGQPAPDRPQLRLLYPDGEIPRIACAGISQYLNAIGIACETAALPAGASWPNDDNWDLFYYDNVLAEPLVDAHRLLGAQGLARGGSAYLELALRRLALADNWNDARAHLFRVHRLAHEEVAVIPLWQLMDHFAYNQNVRGMNAAPVSLYEQVESWQVDPTTN